MFYILFNLQARRGFHGKFRIAAEPGGALRGGMATLVRFGRTRIGHFSVRLQGVPAAVPDPDALEVFQSGQGLQGRRRLHNECDGGAVYHATCDQFG